jgi:hypothetical protein
MAHRYAYIYGDKRSKEFAHVDNLVDTGAAKIRRDAEWITYHCGIEGESAGHARTFKDAKHRARQMRWDLPIGKTTRIVTKKNGEGEPLDVVRFVEFEDEPHVDDGRGVIGIDRIEAFVRDKYPNARWAGDCVCKHTYDGGHSDHADCAAVDYFASWEVMGKMKNSSSRTATTTIRSTASSRTVCTTPAAGRPTTQGRTTRTFTPRFTVVSTTQRARSDRARRPRDVLLVGRDIDTASFRSPRT